MENQTVNNNDEVEIDLGEVFHLLLSKLGVIILSGIVFCLAAVMGTMLLITPKYESTTKIVVLSKQDSSTLTNQDIQTSTSLTKDYAELIKSRTVTEGVIAQLKLDMTHEELLKKLSVDTPTDTRVVSITVTDTDPYTAAQIANAVRDIASKHIQQVMDIIHWNDLYTFPVWYYQFKFYSVQRYDRRWTKRCFQCAFTVYVYAGYAKR